MEIGSRVHLSPLRDEHIKHFMALSADPVLIDTMGWKPFGPDEKARFVRFSQVLTLPHLKDGKSIVFSIIDSSSGRAIGYTAIKGIDKTASSAEVGIAVMDKDYRGAGYGTEALKQVVEYAFKTLGLRRLGLTVFPANLRAMRTYQKLGFKQSGVLENSWLLPGGEYSDMDVMELIRR